jgi:hypothetical protein
MMKCKTCKWYLEIPPYFKYWDYCIKLQTEFQYDENNKIKCQFYEEKNDD